MVTGTFIPLAGSGSILYSRSFTFLTRWLPILVISSSNSVAAISCEVIISLARHRWQTYGLFFQLSMCGSSTEHIPTSLHDVHKCDAEGGLIVNLVRRFIFAASSLYA